MNIFGHIIKDTEIIGIGPILDNCSFELHLKNHTTEIDPRDEKNYEWDELFTEYEKIKKKVADQIDEILPKEKK
jgi:hypothetical protein